MKIVISFIVGCMVSKGSSFLEQLLLTDYKELKMKENKWLEMIIWGVMFALISANSPMGVMAISRFVLLSILMFLTIFDFKYMLLPTKVIYVGLVLGIFMSLIEAILYGSMGKLCSSMLGALLGYGIFLSIFYIAKWWLKKEGLGFGDVRIMALIGWIVGIEQLFLTIIIASLLAVIVGGLLYMIKRKSEAFPFGPFLCSGAALMSLYGTDILKLYLRWLGI